MWRPPPLPVPPTARDADATSLIVARWDELDAATRDAVVRLRVVAWASVGVELPSAGRQDAVDATSLHFLQRGDDGLRAAARLSTHPPDEDLPDGLTRLDLDRPGAIGVLGRCVVAPDARGRGLSATLDAARLSASSALGNAGVLVLTSAEIRRDALVRRGWVVVRPGWSIRAARPAWVLRWTEPHLPYEMAGRRSACASSTRLATHRER